MPVALLIFFRIFFTILAINALLTMYVAGAAQNKGLDVAKWVLFCYFCGLPAVMVVSVMPSVKK